LFRARSIEPVNEINLDDIVAFSLDRSLRARRESATQPRREARMTHLLQLTTIGIAFMFLGAIVIGLL